MQIPLTPLEFMRRARRLYAGRDAVVDGAVRWTYAQFFERCDRWSAALQALGVRKSDRVAYISPNTHAQLASFYAVPADWRRARADQLPPVGGRVPVSDRTQRRDGGVRRCRVSRRHRRHSRQLPGVRHFVALTGAREGWLDYEALVANAKGDPLLTAVDERDLLTINYTSGTTSRPKGVMITHRNAWVNAVGMLMHMPMSPADRYLWTLPMFHANGWTFTWIVTAVGGCHVCLRKVEPAAVFRLIAEEGITFLCAAPTVLIALANASDAVKAGVPRGVRVLTAGAPPAAATIQRVGRRPRLGRHAVVRTHRNLTAHDDLRTAGRACRAGADRSRAAEGPPGGGATRGRGSTRHRRRWRGSSA
jgi:fatty-acyl-CoA synthase